MQGLTEDWSDIETNIHMTQRSRFIKNSLKSLFAVIGNNRYNVGKSAIFYCDKLNEIVI